jgi:FkbM family methyltransferase
MLVPVKELIQQFNVCPSGVLHVGAHLGEEASEYEKNSWTPVIWIEAQPELAKLLRCNLDARIHKVINSCIYDLDGINISLNIASNTQSTSILSFGTHSEDYPTIKFTSSIKVKTQRLDSILSKETIPNLVNLDIQGVELRALKSLGNLIDHVKYIYTEVNRKQVYKDCDLISEIDSYLKVRGFRRIETRWSWKEGWGDALYLHKDIRRRTISQYLKSKYNLMNFYRPQVKSFIKINLHRILRFNLSR